MGRKRDITDVSKQNIALHGKGGFTLAELCVVLAIVVISSIMIVSFSASMKEFATSQREEYDFIEDCSAVKNELYKWISENDVPDADFTDIEDRVKISNGTLYIGDKIINDLQTIQSINFERQGDLIKCNIRRANSDSVKSYVFALRCSNS